MNKCLLLFYVSLLIPSLSIKQDLSFGYDDNFMRFSPLEIDSYHPDFKNSTNCWQGYWMIPTEGTIIVFPSHLVHGVKPNKTRQDRISFSYNMLLTSPLDEAM